MRTLLAASLFALSSVAQAQPALCDMTFTMKVTYSGDPVADSTIVYHGFTQDDALFMHQEAQTILNVASKVQGKGKGPGYSVEFAESGCNYNGGAAVDGVNIQGMSQIMRQASKVGLDLIKHGDDAGAQGKKKAWGRQP